MSKFDFPRSRCRHPPQDRAEIDYASTESHTRGISPGGKVRRCLPPFFFFPSFLFLLFHLISRFSSIRRVNRRGKKSVGSKGKERKERDVERDLPVSRGNYERNSILETGNNDALNPFAITADYNRSV